MRPQRQLIIMELHSNVIKKVSMEMLSIDILCPLSNYFVDAVFSIVETTDNNAR